MHPVPVNVYMAKLHDWQFNKTFAPVHVKQSEGQATQVDPLKYFPLEHELQSENDGPVHV